MVKELKKLSDADGGFHDKPAETPESSLETRQAAMRELQRTIALHEQAKDDDKDMMFTYDWSDEDIAAFKERMQDSGSLTASLDDFEKSDDPNAMFVEHIKSRDGDFYNIHLKGKSPQDAMDKLQNVGLISKDDANLFKDFYDTLKSQNVPTEQIRGGDLSLIKDDDSRDGYAKMLKGIYERSRFTHINDVTKSLNPNVMFSMQDDDKQNKQFDSYEWTDEFIEHIKGQLREQDRLFDNYDDFAKSDNKDGMFIEKNEDGSHTVHLKAEKPQEAMDKLRDAGLISKEDAELFKQFYDDLEAQGVDVSKIRGGDLSLIRDENYRDEYQRQLKEIYSPGSDGKLTSPVYGKDHDDPKPPSPQASNDGPDVKVAEPAKPEVQQSGPSDAELLANLAKAREKAGLSPDGPDVSVGSSKSKSDPEMEL